MCSILNIQKPQISIKKFGAFVLWWCFNSECEQFYYGSKTDCRAPLLYARKDSYGTTSTAYCFANCKSKLRLRLKTETENRD